MEVLCIHNRYRGPSGEDSVYRREVELLREHGHKVVEYQRSNTEVDIEWFSVGWALNAVMSFRSVMDVVRLCAENDFDVAHVHNTWAVVSPGVLWALSVKNIPTVLTLHNYRLECVNGLHMRNSKPCTVCHGRSFPVAGVRFRCYRDSALISALVGFVVWLHDVLGTWEQPECYIALTEFAREHFKRGRLDNSKVVVKPNFVPPPRVSGEQHRNDYYFYAGRLSEEKGVGLLLDVWSQSNEEISLKIAGDGPLRTEVVELASADERVTYLGWLEQDELFRELATAKALLFPSVWFEGMPGVIVEALSLGVPVIGSDIGGIGEMIDDGRNGVLFTPGGESALLDAVRLLENDSELRRELAVGARRRYRKKYSGKANYRQLMDIYEGIQSSGQ